MIQTAKSKKVALVDGYDNWKLGIWAYRIMQWFPWVTTNYSFPMPKATFIIQALRTAMYKRYKNSIIIIIIIIIIILLNQLYVGGCFDWKNSFFSFINDNI